MESRLKGESLKVIIEYYYIAEPRRMYGTLYRADF